MTENKIRVICPRCKGDEKLSMKKYPHGQGIAWVVCPECNGNGYIEAKLIEDIHGKVYLPSS